MLAIKWKLLPFEIVDKPICNDMIVSAIILSTEGGNDI